MRCGISTYWSIPGITLIDETYLCMATDRTRLFLSVRKNIMEDNNGIW